MSFRLTRYSNVDEHLTVYKSDKRYYDVALGLARLHSSGGTYNMACVWNKGQWRETGYNRLDSPAHLKSDIYPEPCGIHAELNLWTKYKRLRGGTVYVAGILDTSRSTMSNTQPCVYCAALLQSSGVRNAVYMLNGVLVKSRVEGLVDAEVCRDRTLR